MVTDLIIYDNEFTNFVLSSLRKYIKGNWENEHAQLFIPYEANDFNIYITTELITKSNDYFVTRRILIQIQ